MADIAKLTPNCRVTITTRNKATYTGVLHSVDEIAGRVVLTSVTTAGVKLYGPQHFYSSDMTDLKCLGGLQAVQKESKSGSSKTGRSRGLGHGKINQPHLARLRNLDTDNLLSIFTEDNGDQGIGSGEDGSVEEYEDFYETEDYTMICRVCEKFRDAIVYIMEQDAVGVTFEGVEIGRNGTLSLIQVATETDLIIFDILRLGEQAFVEGLQALFESREVLKVIHDCRWISDMMHHKYNITLTNIFDTQVANAFVYRTMNSGDWPRYVESLPGCLVNHLNLSHEQVHYMKVRERSREKDQAIWLQRPLPDKFLSSMHRNVVYLLRLYKVLMSKMLLEFKTGVEIYLNHVKDMRGDTERFRTNSHLLPYAFTAIQLLVDDNFNNNKHSYVMHDQMGFRENCLGITDKRIVFSHDSAWHMSNEECAKAFRSSSEAVRKPRPTGGMPADERRRQSHKNRNNISAVSDGTIQKPQRDKINSNSNGSIACESESAVNDSHTRAVYPKEKETAGKSHSMPPLQDTLSVNADHIAENLDTNGSYSDTRDRLQDMMNGHQCSGEAVVPLTSSKKGPKSFTVPLETLSDSNVSENVRRSKLFQTLIKNKDLQELPLESHKSVSKEQSLCQPKHELSPQAEFNLSVQNVSRSGKNFAISKSDSKQPFGPVVRNLNFDASVKYSGSADLPSSQMPSLRKASFDSRKLSVTSSNSSDSGSALEACLRAEARREKNMDSSALLPAGFDRSQVSKRKDKNRQQKQKLWGSESETQDSNSAPLPPPDGDDFGVIPMQHSLRRENQMPLGNFAAGIGDLFSEDENVVQQSQNPKSLIQSRLAFKDENAIRDEDLESFQQSETFQKILKLASSASSKNVLNKLLPPKIKSPSAGLLRPEP